MPSSPKSLLSSPALPTTLTLIESAMAEEESTNGTESARPALLTYKRVKPLPLSPPPTSQRLFKKTPDIPDLSLCHCCGPNYQKSDPNVTSNPIHILKSSWRILLLCETCLARIKSGEICSYCLQNEPDDVAIDDDVAKLESLHCLKCSRRVHFCCIPREHRYDFVTWQKLSKNGNNGFSFNCIDCSPVPKLLVRNRNMSVLELISKEKVADVATGNLLEKRVEDKDLAIQLHLQINGSQRVSRKKGHPGLVLGPGKAKRGKIELYRKRLSLGSIGCKNSRIINTRFSGISFGFNSVVLALESTKCLFEPLSTLKDSSRFMKKYSKRNQVQNGKDDSKFGRENVRDRYEEYAKKKETLTKPAGTNSESQSGSDRYQNKYIKRKRTLEGMVVTNSGSQNRSDRYGRKYSKRRSCLERLVGSKVTENRFNQNAGLKQNITDRFLNKYFKRRRLSVKREDGTCFGTCTAYDQNGRDRYLKKYSKTRKRKAGMVGEQCGIDRYLKKYSKRRLNETMAVTEESQYNG